MLTVNRIKLEILQARSNLSYSDILAQAKITPQTLARIKRGRPCKPETVYKLAKALGVDVAEIVETEEH